MLDFTKENGRRTLVFFDQTGKSLFSTLISRVTQSLCLGMYYASIIDDDNRCISYKVHFVEMLLSRIS